MQWTWQRAGSPVRDTGVNPWPLTPLLAVDESLPAAAPILTSTAFPNIGYDILRDDVDTDGEDYLVMSNTPAPLGHNHDDRTGFSLWGNSTPLALDSGVGGYFNGDNVWFNSASSHNVVQFRQANGTWGGTAAVAEVTDRFYSQAMDYVRVQAPPSGVQGYERHVASIKGDLDAYVVWDRIDSTLPSRFNLHTLTTSIDQHGNRLAAHGYNETDLDVHFLGVDQAQPEIGEGRVSGRWPQPHQQWIQLGAAAGQDHLTVLDPRTADGEPLTTRQIAANGEAKAFELVAADGARWIVLVNGTAAAASLDLPTDGSYTDLRSGRQLAANGGVVTADIPAHGMIVVAG
jgi:hypothetical protein